MTDPSADCPSLANSPVMQAPRGHWFLAWLVIVGLVALIIWMQTVVLPRLRPNPQEQNAAAPHADTIPRLQLRLLVGAGQLEGQRDKLLQQAGIFDTGPVEQRLCYVVSVGELASPRQALTELDLLQLRIAKNNIALTPTQKNEMRSLRRLYEAYAQHLWQVPAVTTEDRQQLVEELGWFGELAQAPPGSPDQAARDALLQPAQHTTLALVGGGVLLGGALGLLGAIALLIFLILLFSGKLQRGLLCGTERAPRCVLDLVAESPSGRRRAWRLASKRFPAPPDHSGVYAETFALWLILFLVLSVAGDLFFTWAKLPSWQLIGQGVLQLGSLLALYWPVLRGIPWKTVCAEIGLIRGRQSGLEPLIGLGNYALMIPLFILGLLIAWLLLTLNQSGPEIDPADNFAPQNLPSHPIVPYIAAGGWWSKLQVFLLACVFAPFVEEIMFRGVLYRQLRELTCRLGFFLSVAVSTLVAGFVFAAIHPQGLLLVPALMLIAVGLTLVREWRGTLVPGMVSHGIHNGIILLIATLVFSS
jgi:membrane protease YdiL (CAAX protease family)